MTDAPPNRSDVKTFFDWELPEQPDVSDASWFRIGAAGAGGLVLLPFGIGLLAWMYAAWLLWKRYGRAIDLTRTPLATCLPEVRRARAHDLKKIWGRSYKRIDKPISELRVFDIKDYKPFEGEHIAIGDLLGPSASLRTISERSVFLSGPARKCRIQIGADSTGRSVEYDPAIASVLYIAERQLIVYNAKFSIASGDIIDESIHKIFLSEIVQIGVKTSSRRFSVSPDDGDVEGGTWVGGLLRRVNIIRRDELSEPTELKDLTSSSTSIVITKTDGRELELPTGPPTVKLRERGVLDGDDVIETREIRVATALQQNIEAAKDGASPSIGAGLGREEIAPPRKPATSIIGDAAKGVSTESPGSGSKLVLPKRLRT